MFGWFSKTPDRATLQNHKTVYVRGSKFVIRPIVPLLDFEPSSMPQIFTDTTRAKVDMNSPQVQKKINEDVMSVLQAGVVEPELMPVGKEDKGITAKDIMRDQEVAGRLYLEIIEHSLFRFRGLKKAFFFLAKRLIQFTYWLKHTASVRQKSLLKEKVPA